MRIHFAAFFTLLYLGVAATAFAASSTAASDAVSAARSAASQGSTQGSAPNVPASSTPRPSAAPMQRDSATVFERDAPVSLADGTLEQAAQRWAHTGDAPVLLGTNGVVMYAYGESHPIVTCAPLRVCVIRLIAGEHITNLAIGDSVRWLIDSAQAGAGADTTPVVITKPTAADLVTNLAITTDAGRVYYLTLRSDPSRYVAEIAFYDPQQIIVRLSAQRAAAEAKAAARENIVVDDLGGVDPASLDFSFSCKAENREAQRWLPVRVFAGGGHTYLQMPGTLTEAEAPALFSLIGSGRHTQTELINSRLLHGYYVIDGLPRRFELLLGAGKAARTVICAHD
jgi:type IV secretion system protein VirB9